MKRLSMFLMVLCGVAIIAGIGALGLAATDSIVPKHGIFTALACGLYIGWYQWKGKFIGK